MNEVPAEEITLSEAVNGKKKKECQKITSEEFHSLLGRHKKRFKLVTVK